MTTNELYHHGILGQKWGVRRFQNKDGSYTSAGRKRYTIDLTANLKKQWDRRIEREKAAKEASINRGKELSSKGESQAKHRVAGLIAIGQTAALASAMYTSTRSLSKSGLLSPGYSMAVKALGTIGTIGITAIGGSYAKNQMRKANDIRAYNTAKFKSDIKNKLNK